MSNLEKAEVIEEDAKDDEIDPKTLETSFKNLLQENNSQDCLSGKTWDSAINWYPSSHSGISSRPQEINFDDVDVEEEEEEIMDFSSTEESSSESSIIGWNSDTSWPDIVLPGTWGTQGLEQVPWADWDKPVAKFKSYETIELNDMEKQGVLTDRIIASCSSYLDRSPQTGKYVLCKCNLADKILCDITILTYHHYLQYLDLSHNNLEDLEPLGQLPFLMYLDVSYNLLLKVLNFKAPFNLTYVNFSHNQVQEISDLTNFWSIVYLDLSHNEICMIEGLSKLKYLRHLDLSYNEIDCLENLNHLRLHTLNLMHNHIWKYEEGENVGLKTLQELIHVKLGHNHLRTLKIFEGAYNIQEINMRANFVDDLMELNYLRDLKYLTEVDFKHNPIKTMKHYYDVCLDCMRALFVLDGELIPASHKVKAMSKFSEAPRKVAIREQASLLLMKELNHPLIGPPVVPVHQPPPPVIILVGPPGSHKGETVRYISQLHEKYARLGISHTTRIRRDDECNGEMYHFISSDVFREMVRNGEFLSVHEHLGQSYGFALTELSKVMDENVVLVFHTEIAAALTLRAKGLMPRLILAMPRTPEMHKLWLAEKYYYSSWNKHPGALLIENWPENCKKLLEEGEKLSQAALLSLTNTLINEIVDYVTSPDVIVSTSKSNLDEASTDEHVDEEQTDEYKTSSILKDRQDETNIFKSDTILSSSRVTSGILKDKSSRSKALGERDHRMSVTFQNETEVDGDIESDTIPNLHYLGTHSSRSVTFRCNNREVVSSQTLPPQSASNTMLPIDEHDQESSINLSALSGIKIHSTKSSEMNMGSASRVTMKLNDMHEKLQFVDNFFNECLNLRDVYMELHNSNLGLFTAVVYTDERENTLKTIKEVLRNCVEEQSATKPKFNFSKDAAYHSIVGHRLENLHDEIDMYLSTGKAQKVSMSKRVDKKPLKSELKKTRSQIIKHMEHASKKSVGRKLPHDAHATPRFSLTSYDDDEDNESGVCSDHGEVDEYPKKAVVVNHDEIDDDKDYFDDQCASYNQEDD